MSEKITRVLSGAKVGQYIILVGATAISVSCLFDPPITGTGEVVDYSTPNGVLQSIALSYNQTDINIYKGALASNFTFFFNPVDVGDIVDGYEIPISWTYTEDWNATYNMFNEAYDVSLTIPEIEAPPPGETTWKKDNVTIDLVVLTEPGSGFKTDSGYCNFEFVKGTGNTGKPRWFLVKWWDHTTE